MHEGTGRVGASSGGSAVDRAVDVTQRSDVEDLVSLALEGYGGLDAMITNPGHALLPALDELRVDEVVARPPAQAWRAVE